MRVFGCSKVDVFSEHERKQDVERKGEHGNKPRDTEMEQDLRCEQEAEYKVQREQEALVTVENQGFACPAKSSDEEMPAVHTMLRASVEKVKRLQAMVDETVQWRDECKSELGNTLSQSMSCMELDDLTKADILGEIDTDTVSIVQEVNRLHCVHRAT